MDYKIIENPREIFNLLRLLQQDNTVLESYNRII